MSTVGLPPSLSLLAAATVVTQPAVVTNLPPGLANLTAGTIINGVVLGRDGKGHTLVRTTNGTLTLTTALLLPTGSALSLQVQTVGTQMQMVVLSVTERPAGDGAAEPVGAPAAAGGGASAKPGADTPVTVTTGTVVTATVVRGPAVPPFPFPSISPSPSPAPAGPAPAATGAVEAQFGVPPGAARAPPAGPGPGFPPGPQSSQPAPAAAGAGGLSPAPLEVGDPSPAPLEVGSRVSLRMIAVDPEQGLDPAALVRTAPAGRPPPPVFAAVVAGRSPAGQVQVETPLGLLTLDAKAPLPPSTRILFEILGPVAPPDPAEGAAPAAARAPLALARAWTALAEAMKALERADPALAQAVMQNVIPRPGSGLAATMLFLLSALRGGDVGGWLGAPVLQALERAGRHDLTARLGDDFAQMARLASDPAAAEWRTLLVPVYDGSAVHLVRLFIKRRPRRNDVGDERAAGTRFLVEVELSRLGPMQLDGLVQEKRFDLIVRSHAHLPRQMRKDIFAIFDDALAATGYSGGVTFQAMPAFAVSPLNELGARPVGLSV